MFGQVSVTADTVLRHLPGRQVIGVYLMLEDETCCFLAADFVKEAWRGDVLALTETCRRVGVPYWKSCKKPMNGITKRNSPGCPILATRRRSLNGKKGKLQFGLQIAIGKWSGASMRVVRKSVSTSVRIVRAFGWIREKSSR